MLGKIICNFNNSFFLSLTSFGLIPILLVITDFAIIFPFLSIISDLKSFFIKQGYKINWKDLEKQSLDQTINTLAMASPFSLEEKQVLLEATNIYDRKEKLSQILSTYSFDNFDNKTIQ